MSSISFKPLQEVSSIIASYCIEDHPQKPISKTESDRTTSEHEKIRSIVMGVLANQFPIDSTTIMNPSSTQSRDYSDYILPSDYCPRESRTYGVRPCRLFTYMDDSSWVPMSRDTGKERICGFFYLQRALKEKGGDKIKAAENRMAIVNGEIVYLSRYCGEDQPRKLDEQELSVINEVGYADINMGPVNLRRKGDTLYIFDTEKSSFNKRVHGQIDEYSGLHDAIHGILEEHLKTWTQKEPIVPPGLKALQDLWNQIED